MKYYTMTGILTNTERRNCSIYGNPAWNLTIEYDGEYITGKTASDAQYNLVAENGIFRVYSDFGRVLFEILTESEPDAINAFKDFFGKNATYERFYLGFGN